MKNKLNRHVPPVQFLPLEVPEDPSAPRRHRFYRPRRRSPADSEVSPEWCKHAWMRQTTWWSRWEPAGACWAPGECVRGTYHVLQEDNIHAGLLLSV